MSEVKIMNEDYYNSLDGRYKDVSLKNLPEPCKGVPLTSEEYDYKTYWTYRRNDRQKEIDKPKETCVYLLVSDELFKIGISNDLDRRVHELSNASGRQITAVCSYVPENKTAISLERALHKKYDEHRVRGEWFNTTIPKEEFLSEIESMDYE